MPTTPGSLVDDHPQNPPTAKAGLHPLTPKEEVLRHAAAACSDARTPDCQKTIHVGIFFDGTNNNMDRDKAEFPPSHSNVVTLYETYSDKLKDGYYRYYVPGVGTKFMDIGEPTESDDGKAYGKGGDPRINWALIQLVNSIHRAVFDDAPLLGAQEAGIEASLWPLYDEGSFDAARREKRMYFCEGLKGDDQKEFRRRKNLHCSVEKSECKDRQAKLEKRKKSTKVPPSPAEVTAIDQELAELDQRIAALEKYGRRDANFKPLLTRLTEALRSKKLPKVRLVNVSVFGFSRGAAQARAFCTFLQDILTAEGLGFFEKWMGKDAPGYALAGIPLRVQFLGLFDTVASAGMADASPLWRGFGGWANNTMDIPSCVERSVHYVAAHELRHAFPSSSLRRGKRVYPKNGLEVIYPGAHSNVGGGYNPGCQGKSRGGRRALLSQIPLTHMYKEARLWGVPLQSEAELLGNAMGRGAVADMQIADETERLFNAYLQQTAVTATPAEDMLKQHTQAYWRWREQKSPEEKFMQLDSVRNAPPQDRQDLIESEEDYRRDRSQVQQAMQAAVKAGHEDGDTPRFEPVASDYLQALQKPPLAAAASDFFDKLLHDSHATFYMLGPTTALDRRDLYEALLEKDPKTLNGVERRIVAGKGVFPILADADTQELLAAMKWYSRWALKYGANQTTRRETGGHIHYRRVFDAS
ncbi:T6SS phospholipase effector Tle1-like catalytic domain-containing protein [Variovorax boronicumulans]|nr:DUF2235 domain-containing protein [Variovorax boronicumulans]